MPVGTSTDFAHIDGGTTRRPVDPQRRQARDVKVGVMVDLHRICAATAAAVTGLGAGGLLVAASDTPSSSFVSEAGVDTAAFPLLYRASIWCVAVALALLAVPARRSAGLAALALAVAAPFAALSATVTCSPGCPLPPFEVPATRDLLHAGGTIVALLLCGAAMLVYAMTPPNAPLRRLGRVGVAVPVPLLGLAGAALVLAGRGMLTGVLERVALAAAFGWLIAAALLHTRPGLSAPAPVGGAPVPTRRAGPGRR